MIDIDPDIEKQISLIQEEKLNSKIKEDIKKVVKVKEKPEEKLVDFFSIIAQEKKQTREKIVKSEKKIADIEELFASLKKEKKKTKPKKELLLEPEKPKEEIKEEEQTVSEILQDELEPIETDETVIGKVTSAVYSPRLKKNIALAMIAIKYSNIGGKFKVKTNDGQFNCAIVEKPFYDPKKKIASS